MTKNVILVVLLLTILDTDLTFTKTLRHFTNTSAMTNLGMQAETRNQSVNTKHAGNNRNSTESHWYPWSTCRNCYQWRFKKNLDSGIELYEERLCNRKRCKKKMHIIRSKKPKSKKNQLKQYSSSSFWSKWSDWSICNLHTCETSRVRYCKDPNRCNSGRQKQIADCFYEGTMCEIRVAYDIENVQSTYQESKRRNNGTHQAIATDIRGKPWRHKKPDNSISTDRKKPNRFGLNPSNCGIPFNNNMLKILGGTDATKDKWPWHVLILNEFQVILCGGSIIAPYWILTAAHCVRPYLRVRLNEHDLRAWDGRELELRVKASVPHPGFRKKTVENDIALLLLPQPAESTPVCLPRRPSRPGEMCHVVGWGSFDHMGQYILPVLQEAKIPTVKKWQCRKSYYYLNLTPEMICAGWPSGKSDTCTGDSGGGLMCPMQKSRRRRQFPEKNYRQSRFVLQGITSFGDGCGKKDTYGIYTDVARYLPWIMDVMKFYESFI